MEAIRIVALVVALLGVDRFVTPDKLPRVVSPRPPAVVPDDGRGGAAVAIDEANLRRVMTARVPARRTQCLFFTASWCASCEAAKADLEAWLKPAGWMLGDEEDAHFRYVDFESNPDMAKEHGVTTLPTFVLTVGGNVISKRSGYPGRQQLVKEFLEASRNFSPPRVEGVRVGTIQRSYVDIARQWLGSEGSASLGNDAISHEVSGVTVTVPANVKLSWSTSNGAMKVESRPGVRVEWQGFSREIGSATVNDREIALSVPWAPDVTLEIVDDQYALHATPRSPQWPAVREKFLREHPACEACGRRDELNVHHVVPFHVDRSKELDPDNLITLCREHHWSIGHDPDGPDGPERAGWNKCNPRVREDAERFRRVSK
jgi:thiol-disulfide isomerase/thioredoxin